MESRNGEVLRFVLAVGRFLWITAFFLGVPALSFAASWEDGQTMHLRLFHRNELEFRQPAGHHDDEEAMLQYLRELTERDLLRQRRMYNMISPSRRKAAEIESGLAAERSFEAPISSGAYVGVGEYFVKLRVGTPAREYLLVADTGSDLTWTKCASDEQLRPGGFLSFPAVGSGSFVPIPCSSDMCKSVLPFTLASCPTTESPCHYDFQYVDGSFTRGIYANETVSAPTPDGIVSEIRDVLIGCSSEFQGKSFNRSDGVLGLGQSAVSFAVTAAKIYGGKFSYCLVDHLSRRDVHNYLVFGQNPRFSNQRDDVRFTPLVLDASIQPFYGLVVRGISVDGSWLPIPELVWKFQFSGGSASNGVIIDSGMTLTTLVRPAYDVVMAAFQWYFRNSETFQLAPFQLCFNTTGLTARETNMMGPRMVIHLGGGARFIPHTGGYIVAVARNVRCVGIVPGSFPGLSVIGNILQQHYVWEYDLLNAKLGFAPSHCRN
ncbi:aspartic proteinase NANA, chloroplast-like [Nymphaea colorata]|uniref:Peptidase A1 domain-containing protein n=1 Tax=Nymphaea colorata TaxID=210225 RepID=A0A5K0WCA2_9MAGN|nr:aspartic proteinase NANA, chloroplast-like [Nymphaea colorata]